MTSIENSLNELSSNLYLSDYYTKGIEVDEFIDEALEGIYSQEIIYYYKAMEYLKEHDNSLNLSLEIADELGYETSSLNSELLATLLYQDNLRNELYNLQYEIDEILSETCRNNKTIDKCKCC
tara:strand:+ start:66 stop:434 length:369 start_codon:yes stop_codon:yes gene_type:complete